MSTVQAEILGEHLLYASQPYRCHGMPLYESESSLPFSLQQPVVATLGFL